MMVNLKRFKISLGIGALTCILLSLILNIIVYQQLRHKLSQKSYILEVDINYSIPGTIELHYDTGEGFNNIQEVTANVKHGNNLIKFPFRLPKKGQLKYLRLDFGSNSSLKIVEINSIKLLSHNKTYLNISKKRISQSIVFLKHCKVINKSVARLQIDNLQTSLDPYFFLKPLNELIYPKWVRVLLLIFPWFIFFFILIFKWLKQLKSKQNILLLFIAIFIATIPLKIAWVTFSTLLLLAFALLNYYSKRKFYGNSIQLLVALLFFISLLLLGDGDFTKLAIPIGFLMFPVIGSTIDFRKHYNAIKKIYVVVFFLLSTILITSWLLLILYNGYYYNINLFNYFYNIKANAHYILYWLYYGHTTFLSFFILIGIIFCFDLFKSNQISKYYFLTYMLFSVSAIVLLGSRFTFIILLFLPILFKLSARKIVLLILPLSAAVFGVLNCNLEALDDSRSQLWKISWMAIIERPWLGHGTGSSEIIFKNLERVQQAGFDSLPKLNHSHNQFLTYLMENGIVGLSLFIGIFVCIVFSYAKQNNKLMLLICFLLILIMLIESPFKTATPLYMISFLLSVFSKKNC